jgi:hypothetical protein
VEYWTDAVKSPAGRVLGYVVKSTTDENMAFFYIRNYPSWRIAKEHAERLMERLGGAR